MKVLVRDPAAFAQLDPFLVLAYLRSTGWEDQGHPSPLASIWRKDFPVGPAEIMVPLTTDLGDFIHRMADCVVDLSKLEDRSMLEVLADLAGTGVDRLRVRAQVHDTTGHEIPLNEGVKLVQGTRDLLMASACATLQAKALYPTRKPTKANQYLAQVRLAQPERGSFVLVAHSPVSPELQRPLAGLEALADAEVPFERQVLTTLNTALQGAKQAAEQALRLGSLDSFSEAVGLGVSANFCQALNLLNQAGGDAGLDLGFAWSPRRPLRRVLPNRLVLAPNLFEAIKQAPKALAANNPTDGYELRGLVVKLEREAKEGQPRQATVLELADTGQRRVKVSLDEAAFPLAIQAFEDDLPILVRGLLQKEGRGFILQQPQGFAIDTDQD